MNAKTELIQHIDNRLVTWVKIKHRLSWTDDDILIEGTLEEVLPALDFVYDCGFGSQKIEGIIWYEDGTWSERGEYDGSEWWEHKERPPLPASFVKRFEQY